MTPDAVYEWLDEFEIPHECYLETSAKAALNIEQAFSLAVKRWSQIEQKRDQDLAQDTVKVDEVRGIRSNGCC